MKDILTAIRNDWYLPIGPNFWPLCINDPSHLCSYLLHCPQIIFVSCNFFFTYILSILLLNDVSWNFNGNKIVLTEKNWLQKILLHKMAARRRLKIVSCRFSFLFFFKLFLSEMCSLIKLVDSPPRSQTSLNSHVEFLFNVFFCLMVDVM